MNPKSHEKNAGYGPAMNLSGSTKLIWTSTKENIHNYINTLLIREMAPNHVDTNKGNYVESSVADPDPDPPDPRVLGPPGSGSGSSSQRYGSGSGSCSGS